MKLFTFSSYARRSGDNDSDVIKGKKKKMEENVEGIKSQPLSQAANMNRASFFLAIVSRFVRFFLFLKKKEQQKNLVSYVIRLQNIVDDSQCSFFFLKRQRVEMSFAFNTSFQQRRGKNTRKTSSERIRNLKAFCSFHIFFFASKFACLE